MSDQTPDRPPRPPWAPVNASGDDDNAPETPPTPPTEAPAEGQPATGEQPRDAQTADAGAGQARPSPQPHPWESTPPQGTPEQDTPEPPAAAPQPPPFTPPAAPSPQSPPTPAEPQHQALPWEEATPASAGQPESPPAPDERAPSAPPARPRFRMPEPTTPAPDPTSRQSTRPENNDRTTPERDQPPTTWQPPQEPEASPQSQEPGVPAPALPPAQDPEQPPWAALDEQLNPPRARETEPPEPGTEEFSPSAPPMPAFDSAPPPRQIPEPIDVDTDDDDVREPTHAPPPEETFPATGRTRGSLFAGAVSPYDHPQDPEAPAAPGGPQANPSGGNGEFHSLGHSAVTNASLSAGGAHTPMGGVPLASSRGPHQSPADETPREYGDDAPAFTPRFEPTDRTYADHHQPTGEQPTVRFASISDPSPGIYPDAGQQPTSAPDATYDGDGGSRDGAHDHGVHVPWWRSAVALIIYGLVLMGGLGYGAYYFLLQPEPIALAAPVLLEGPPDNGVTPIEIEDPTPFLEVVPTGTLTHSLIDITTFEPGELTALPARIAEAHELTYSDAADTYVVRAYQHYNTDDALENYQALAGESTDVEAVMADGTEVGERAVVNTEDGSMIVWRNETAVMTLTGPEPGLVDFYTFYDL